jgi:hypothetical protein
MLSDNDFDSLVLNYRTLLPDQRHAVRQHVIRRAHAERNAATKAAANAWSVLRPLMGCSIGAARSAAAYSNLHVADAAITDRECSRAQSAR